MKELVCQFTLFDLHQRIFILDKETQESKPMVITTLKQIPEAITQLSNKEQIYDIHLFGNKVYAQHLKKDILEYNAQHYNINKINVEVN